MCPNFLTCVFMSTTFCFRCVLAFFFLNNTRTFNTNQHLLCKPFFFFSSIMEDHFLSGGPELHSEKAVIFTVCVVRRHRAVNLFLQGYEKSWIETEEHYFEDKLIEDLAVSAFMVLIQHHAVRLGKTSSFTGFGNVSVSWAEKVIRKAQVHGIF